MEKEFDVVALGELLIDFTENGISKQGNPILEANPGGEPCNVLAMLNQYHKKTAFIGKVGNDNFGNLLKETIQQVGINTIGLLMDREIPTTLAFVHTKPDGDRSFSFYRNPGADMMLRAEEVNEHLISNTKIFHFGTLSMTDPNCEAATRKAVEIAQDSGALISFDPNLRPPLWKDLETAKEKMEYGIRICNILKISDDEIEFFTGCSDPLEGAIQIKETYGTDVVCATLGKDGSYGLHHHSVVKADPFPNPDTIETTGAGDTFMACLLNGILECGMEELDAGKLSRILREANAAASIITTRRGALKVMPSIDEINRFIIK